jgi:NADH-quinone oxidoreductase subunit N
MLMAVAVGTPDASRAVMLYLVVYLVMNLGAFLAVMAVRARTGSEAIRDYRGLGTRSPYLAAVLAIFLFSLTGLPPLAGFIGKFYLFAAVLEKGGAFYVILAIVGVVNSAISLYYYARVVVAMYMVAPEAAPDVKASPGLLTALTASVALTVLIGVYPQPFIRFAQLALLPVGGP